MATRRRRGVRCRAPRTSRPRTAAAQPRSAESSAAAAATATAASSSRAAKRKAGADTLTAATTRPRAVAHGSRRGHEARLELLAHDRVAERARRGDALRVAGEPERGQLVVGQVEGQRAAGRGRRERRQGAHEPGRADRARGRLREQREHARALAHRQVRALAEVVARARAAGGEPRPAVAARPHARPARRPASRCGRRACRDRARRARARPAWRACATSGSCRSRSARRGARRRARRGSRPRRPASAWSTASPRARPGGAGIHGGHSTSRCNWSCMIAGCSPTPCRATSRWRPRRSTSSSAAGSASSPRSACSSTSRGRSSCSGRRVRTSRATSCKFDPEFVLEQVAKAPSEFRVHARNPEHDVHIGGDRMMFLPAQGPPFVRIGDERRDGTLADLVNFIKLAQMQPELDTPGGNICEPDDVPLDSRHLVQTLALIVHSDKIFKGIAHVADGAARTRSAWARSCSAGARRSSSGRGCSPMSTSTRRCATTCACSRRCWPTAAPDSP